MKDKNDEGGSNKEEKEEEEYPRDPDGFDIWGGDDPAADEDIGDDYPLQPSDAGHK